MTAPVSKPNNLLIIISDERRKDAIGCARDICARAQFHHIPCPAREGAGGAAL